MQCNVCHTSVSILAAGLFTPINLQPPNQLTILNTTPNINVVLYLGTYSGGVGALGGGSDEDVVGVRSMSGSRGRLRLFFRESNAGMDKGSICCTKST